MSSLHTYVYDHIELHAVPDEDSSFVSNPRPDDKRRVSKILPVDDRIAVGVKKTARVQDRRTSK